MRSLPNSKDRLTFDADGTVDELVMSGAYVHLEHLGDGEYMLIAENTADHVHLNVSVRRRKGVPAVSVYERYRPLDLTGPETTEEQP